MARAYLSPHGDFWLWNPESKSLECACEPECTAFTRDVPLDHFTPIPEWDAADWDSPPEYVMAHSAMFTARKFACGTAGPMMGANAATIDEAVVICKRYGHDSVYERTENPEVLKRVWQKVDSPRVTVSTMSSDTVGGTVYLAAEISAVDWAAVYRGELIPPARVVVLPHLVGRELCITANGSTIKSQRTYDIDAAHYSTTGQLLGYRTAEGWKNVAGDDGARQAVDSPEATSTEVPESQAGERPAPTQMDAVERAVFDEEFVKANDATREPLHTEGDRRGRFGRTFDLTDYFYGPNGVHARRQKANELAYLRGETPDPEWLAERGAFQVEDK